MISIQSISRGLNTCLCDVQINIPFTAMIHLNNLVILYSHWIDELSALLLFIDLFIYHAGCVTADVSTQIRGVVLLLSCFMNIFSKFGHHMSVAVL